MNRTAIIIITAVLLGIGVMVFLVLNRPANFAIRKTFTALTGLMVVGEDSWKEAQEKNKALQLEVKDREKIIQARERETIALNELVEKYQMEYSDLEKELQKTAQQLKVAQQAHQELTVTQQLILFDQQTEGEKVSTLADDIAQVEPARIASANWQMHQRRVFGGQIETQQRMISAQRGEIQALQSINANLLLTHDDLRAQIVLKDEQIENLLRTNKEVIQTANRRMFIGILVGIAGVVITIL